MRGIAKTVLLGAGALLVASSVATPGALVAEAGAASLNYAGVVIRFSNTEVRHQCVAFSEDKITGWDLLRRTSFEVRFKMYGNQPFIWRIDDVGCSSDNCADEYPTFWGYWNRERDGAWSFASKGAAARNVQWGSVDGWSWGENGRPAPPSVPFSQVCPNAGSPPPSSTHAPAPTQPPASTPKPPSAPKSSPGQGSSPAQESNPASPPSGDAGPTQGQNTGSTNEQAPSRAEAPTTSPAQASTDNEDVPLAEETSGTDDDEQLPASLDRAQSESGDQDPASSSSYIAFVAFLAIFVAAGAGVVFARRRRAG